MKRIKVEDSWVRRFYFASAFVACLTLVGGNTAFAQLEITEVMFNPIDDNVWEWIEVRNTGGSSVDLNGYLGFNLGDIELTAPNPTINNALAQNTVIGAGQVAVIYDANYGSGNAPMGNPNNFVDADFRSAWGLAPTVPLIGANFWPGLSNTTGSQGQSIGFWPDAATYAMDISPVEDPDNPGTFINRVTSFANTAFSLDYSGNYYIDLIPDPVPGPPFPADDGMSSITWTGNGSNQIGSNWTLSVSGSNGAVTSVPVQVPGFINSDADIGNPGIVPTGTPGTAGLYFSEIMFNPASPEDDWEWVELYNSTLSAVDLSGYIFDDDDNPEIATGNIASGSIAAGGTAILYNADDVSSADFAAAWGGSLNLVGVTTWPALGNSSGDAIVLKNGSGTTVASQSFLAADGFPNANGSSISPFDLSSDLADGGNWDLSLDGDSIGSFNANLVADPGGMVPLHAGGDVGSPGSFGVVVGIPGDFDMDGNVDGNDFLVWQRNPAVGNLSDWQSNYGTPLSATIGAVPEPATLVMLGLALMPLTCGRKR
ncbi:lamin tail domain-containing protein [Bythopirellula goksoeyrii]|uniref:LTD domain-containing protein n=1 Tax=Bythopirellula goksoeyrii TaxID=1400387 RepID=A0A5B9Q8F3_9BACT|nr:lamin tail domain-containing protein [Bythopirellula goksoeyrii]QEG34030.1 hypothetical protein Pr1d_13020 [Bythopirellula goksoeyrii]